MIQFKSTRTKNNEIKKENRNFPEQNTPYGIIINHQDNDKDSERKTLFTYTFKNHETHNKAEVFFPL